MKSGLQFAEHRNTATPQHRNKWLDAPWWDSRAGQLSFGIGMFVLGQGAQAALALLYAETDRTLW